MMGARQGLIGGILSKIGGWNSTTTTAENANECFVWSTPVFHHMGLEGSVALTAIVIVTLALQVCLQSQNGSLKM
jgi:hypothetical protein